MKLSTLAGAVILVLAAESIQTPMGKLNDILVYTAASKRIQKRAVSSRKGFEEFIQEKLVQHGQALEQLLKVVKENEAMTKQLVENLSRSVEPPKMPDKIEFTRRSFNDKPDNKDNDHKKKLNPWCSLSLLCPKSLNPIFGYDEKFGCAKFDDICQMVQVNCYWKYNFTLVYSCRPHL